MPSGGSRTAVPGLLGGLHPNRSDLTQPAQAPVGGMYGSATASLQAQSVVPVAGSQSPSAGGGATVDPNIIPAGTIPSLTDPSARPNEPVTAGLTSGAGPGPEVLSTPQAAFGPPELSLARELYKRAPNNDILQLIEFMQNRL